MILGIIAGAGFFLLFLIGHAVILRTQPAAEKPRVNQVWFLIGLIGIIATLWPLMIYTPNQVLTHGRFVLAAFCGVLLYAGLFVLYMPFYYVVASSLSVRTIVLLSRKPGRALSLASLQDEFVSTQLVGGRLDTMVENGFLCRAPCGYELTAKGAYVASIFDSLKRIWKLGAGG